MLILIGGMARPALGETTLPVLWTAGGVDSGSTGAGSAGHMAVDASGNIAVTSGPSGGRDLAVTSYTATGSFRWRSTITPSTGTYRAGWVEAAPNGDFVAVGYYYNSRGYAGGSTLVRYASNGMLQWRRDVLGMPTRLVVDAGGNTYLAFGSSTNNVGAIDVRKYDASGVLVWANAMPVNGTLTSVVALSLALSPDEADVVVTGAVPGGALWVTAAYDTAAGTRRWVVTAPEGVAALDVVVDASRVYVTGQGVTDPGTPAMAYHLTVVSYERGTGARLWRTDSRPPEGAIGLRIALAPDGGVVAAGRTDTAYTDWWIVAMNPDGTLRWQTRRDRRTGWDEVPEVVFVLADGTAVVSGPGGPALPGGYVQGVTAGYSPTGVELWNGFSALATVWAVPLPNGDVCATGGYDALVTCFAVGAPVSPPAAPSGLAAKLATGSIVLTWQDNANNETAYSLERAENGGLGWSAFAGIATLPADATSYADTNFTIRSYRYRVRASNSGGASAYSNIAEIGIIGVPTVPVAVMTATPSSGTAPLTVNFDGSGSYDLEGFLRSWNWAFGDGTVGTGVTTAHVYSTPGTYTARLTVTDSGGATNTTSTSIVVNAPALPSAPATLTATAQSRSSIVLNWTNRSTSQIGLKIERCKGSSCTNFTQIALVAGGATTFTNSGLSSDTWYRYRVRAYNSTGNSAYSNIASAKTSRR